MVMRSPPGRRLTRNGRLFPAARRIAYGSSTATRLAGLKTAPCQLEWEGFKQRRIKEPLTQVADLRPARWMAAKALQQALESRQAELLQLAHDRGLRRPDKVWPRLAQQPRTGWKMLHLIERWEFWQASGPVPWPGVCEKEAGLECGLTGMSIRLAGHPDLSWHQVAYPPLRRGVRDVLLACPEVIRYRALIRVHAREYWAGRRRRMEKARLKRLADETAKVQAEIDAEKGADTKPGTSA